MQTSNRLFDDVAKVANGAISTVTGMKSELEALVRHQIEKLLVDSDLVARDEFEAVKAMAAEARLQQEKLEVRVANLEAQLAKASGSSTAPRARKATRSTAKSKS